MKKQALFTIIAAVILSTGISAQFPIRIPKIAIPNVQAPKESKPESNEKDRAASAPQANNPSVTNSSQANSASSLRQMVMDDGYTFFSAKPVKERNSRNDGDVDVGWYLDPQLRLMGTFPDNSGFRVVVKQNGKELSKIFCSGSVYRQEDDRRFSRERKKYGWGFDDYMNVNSCSNKEKAVKEIGWMDVELFYVDGDTDKETLVRKHRIDVHKAQQLRGVKGKLYPGVSEYFIQRYAEAATGFIYAGGGSYMNNSGRPFAEPTFTPLTKDHSIEVFMPYVPDKRTYYKTYVRCSVNGKKITIERDAAQLDSSHNGQFAESALMQRSNPRYEERITFTYLKATLPVTLSPGKWECSFNENGTTYRTIRFDVGSDNQIVPHPEQKNGNVNLYYKTYLIEVEIPADAPIDDRSLPLPDTGLFYGIPWRTPEGKAAAAKVPTKGKPYPVMPT